MAISAASTARYAIELDSKQLQGSAEVAERSLNRLTNAITKDINKLKDLENQQLALRASGRISGTAYDKLTQKIEAQRSKIKSQKEALASAGEQYKKATRAGQSFREQLSGIGKELSKAGGPLGTVASRVSGLVESLGAGKTALLGTVAASAALVAGASYLATKLFNVATAAAEARQSELLLLQGTASLGRGWSTAAEKGQQAQDAIDAVAGASALSRDKVAELAGALLKARTKSEDMESSLRAASQVAVVQGQEAANAFVDLAAMTSRTGGEVDKLAKRIDGKIGGIADAALMKASVQAQKLDENVQGLFRKIKIDGLDLARKRLFDLVNQSTAAGKAISTFLTPLGQGLIDVAAKAMTAFERAGLYIVKWTNSLRIQWLDLKIAFYQAFGPATNSGLGKFLDKIDWGAVIAGTFATAVIGIGTAMLYAAGPVLAFGAAIMGAYSVVDNLYQLWKEIPWKDLGSAIVNGVIQGMMNAGAKLYEFVDKMANKVQGAFKKALGIHSPSKVFAGLGAQIPAGIKQGIDQGARGLNQQVGSLIDIRAPELRGQQSISNDNSSRTVQVNITNNFASPGSEADRNSLEQSITQLFGRLAQQNGAV